MRGNRVRKVSATIYSAFSSPSFPDLAHLGVGIDFNPQLLLNVKDKEYAPRFKINPNVIQSQSFLDATRIKRTGICTKEAFEVSSWRRLASVICPTTNFGFLGYEFNERKDSQCISLRSAREALCIQSCTWRDRSL